MKKMKKLVLAKTTVRVLTELGSSRAIGGGSQSCGGLVGVTRCVAQPPSKTDC